MIFAMSDIHGHYTVMQRRIEQIKPYLEENNKLILLGDYIDRGRDSFQCLKAAYDLQQHFGEDKVVVLKGNHEKWFQEFLFDNEDIWLAEDSGFCTSRTFLTEEQFKQLRAISDREERIGYIKELILANHKELMTWMSELKGVYETETQIFVHAGVDEDISEDAAEWCARMTPEYILTGKYPPTRGYFYKDIIAGHVAASRVAHNRKWKGVYFDGASHYYIDGSVARTKRLLCLAYDEDAKTYYEFIEDGAFKVIERRNKK